jgi:hypothetical protein
MRAVMSSVLPLPRSSLQTLVREQRRQVLEQDLVLANCFGRSKLISLTFSSAK